MLGEKKRRSRADQVAEEAWEDLVSAVESAGGLATSTARSVRKRTGETARSVGSRAADLAGDLAEGAQDRVSSVADEAWERATNAFDALAGRKPRRPWGWIALGVLGGIAVGWAVAASAPKAITAAMDRFNDEPQDEFVTGPSESYTPTPAPPSV